MKRRILTIGAIAIMSISLLAGCDSKNDYKSEVKEFEKCVNTVKKSTKKIDSNDFVSAAKATPLEGYEGYGRIEYTFYNGGIVWEQNTQKR